MTETFTNRKLETVVVTSIERYEDSYNVGTQGSWGFSMPHSDRAELIKQGDIIQLETKGFNTIGGVKFKDEWVFHRSDEYFDEQHAKYLENWEKRKQKLLDDNREDWRKRTEALPIWLRERIERFRAKDPNTFDLEDWGYELMICELAEIYSRNGNVDDEEINAFANREGTSGNQHNMAQALVRFRVDEDRIPLGLTPLR